MRPTEGTYPDEPPSVSFSLGRLFSTPGALQAMEASGQSPTEFIGRHLSGDWGIVCEEDSRSNRQAVLDGSRILSVYETRDAIRLWVITEAEDDAGNRMCTTILLPQEY